MTTQIDGLTLYHYPACPFCRRVATHLKANGVVIAEKNIMQDGGARQELMQGGGSGQVPCLRIEQEAGDHWMYESMDIIRYIDDRLKNQ